jgi:Mrr restriction endonuclease-like protein
MALPPVVADKISSAMTQFDDEIRSSAEWANWEESQSHRYAINNAGKLYPVKQIVSMATGVNVASFSGGSEANDYVKQRGFEVEPLRLPTEAETRIALHELLLQRSPHSITPHEAYQELADRFRLSSRLRTQLMQNSHEVHWENPVRFARRKLVDAELLDGSEQGIWKLKVRTAPCVWVEKVLVEERPDRLGGEYALGKAIWSPKRTRSDGDDYWAMRQVQPGDYIIHLIDNRDIAGVSKVASYADMDFRGLPNTAWAGMDGYLVRLTGFQRCEPPLNRKAFLGNPAFGAELRKIRAAHKHLFYDRDLNLNQGFYLTPAPAELGCILINGRQII